MNGMQRLPPNRRSRAQVVARAGAPRSRPTLLPLLLAILASTVGCFEDRIEERMVIGVSDRGVELFYEVTYHERHGHGDRAAQRVADHERQLLDGENPWLAALTSLPDPLQYGSEATFDGKRRDDAPELERHTAWARSARGNAALGHLFGHTAINASLAETADSIELDLTAGSALGGTRRQRQRMERQVQQWSAVVAGYVDRVADVWRYMEANPSRERPIYEAIFSDLLDPTPDPDLSPPEEALLDRLDEAEGAVAEIFQTEQDHAYTLQELSRLIYDPYPMEIRVARLGRDGRVFAEPPLEVDGLEAQDDGSWRVRRTSLWDAYAGLRGRWVTPDPLAIKVEALRQVDAAEGETPDFDLEALLRRPPRVHGRPTAFEVADQLRTRLAPPDVVRIAWPRTTTHSER